MIQTDLTGRTALVTGASGGFGHRFAVTLAAQGAEVVAAARRTDVLESLVAEIGEAGGAALAVQLDVTDAAAVERTLAALPDLDIVVNNAGVAGASQALDCREDKWRRTYDVNVHGVWFVAGTQRCACRRWERAAASSTSPRSPASVRGSRPPPTPRRKRRSFR